MTSTTTAQSERVTVAGSWSQVIDVLESSYLSQSPMSLQVTALGKPGRRWYLEVSRTEAGWHPDLLLEVSTDQGNYYREVEAVPRRIIEGTSHTNEVLDLQYRLTGMTTAVPPGTYATTVTFTITFVD